MQLYIKNMVCDRCIMVVRQQLDTLGLTYKNIRLGEAELADSSSPEKLQTLNEQLHGLGFEVLDDKKTTIVEKIKTAIIQLIQREDEEAQTIKLSVLLHEKLQMDYHYLSGLFSSIEGITIEKYVILQRIEKAKELLMYDELSLGQIADKLCYSSIQHLSQQFKRITGLTPTHFKQLRENMRKPIDKV